MIDNMATILAVKIVEFSNIVSLLAREDRGCDWLSGVDKYASTSSPKGEANLMTP